MTRSHRTRSSNQLPSFVFGSLLVALVLASPGCSGPRIPPEELGEVLTELPKLPEAEKPYERPELVADGLEVPAAKAQALPSEGEPRSDEPESDATTADAPQSNPPETTSPDDPK